MVRTTFEHVSSENTLTQAALSVSNNRSQWQVRLVYVQHSSWRSRLFDERAVRSVRSVRFDLPVGAPVRSTNARSGRCGSTFRLALRFVRRTRGPVGAAQPNHPTRWRSGSFDERAVRSVRTVRSLNSQFHGRQNFTIFSNSNRHHTNISLEYHFCFLFLILTFF